MKAIDSHQLADATPPDGLATTAVPGVAAPSFTATPSSVITGGTTTLARRVGRRRETTTPDLKLNGELIGTIGHREVHEPHRVDLTSSVVGRDAA